MDRIAFAGLLALLALTGCQQPQTQVAAAPAAPPPLVPFDEAVNRVGNAVLATAAAKGERRTIVIDPLVNGVTGEQTVATKQIGSRLADLARTKYPNLEVKPFSAESVGESPLVLIGTFTPVNAQNQPSGTREAFRFCLVVADLKAGQTIAKSVARATPAGVVSTPTKSFADAPAWTEDASIKSYITTCQGTKVGDAIPPSYLSGIVTAATINQAIDAYDAGHYQDALQFYDAARRSAAGDQLRVLNGLYLTHAKLGPQTATTDAFGELVDYGLKNNRLGVKFLFRPASTAFDTRSGSPYEMWLRQISDRGVKANACLQVTGNTSASGSPALNDRLSVLRAEYVKGRLEQDAPALHGHVIATGVGANQVLIGTGTDDAADALDRRVEFKVLPSC